MYTTRSPVQGLRRSTPEATRIFTKRRVRRSLSVEYLQVEPLRAETLSRRDSDNKRNPRFCAEEQRRLSLALGPAARPPKMSSGVQARIRPAEQPVQLVSSIIVSNEIPTSICHIHQNLSVSSVITVTWRSRE